MFLTTFKNWFEVMFNDIFFVFLIVISYILKKCRIDIKPKRKLDSVFCSYAGAVNIVSFMTESKPFRIDFNPFVTHIEIPFQSIQQECFKSM